MDTISVLIGFLVGVVATMIAVEFGLKKIFRPPALNKVTGSWRLDDHKSPLVVAQDAAGIGLPTGSRVVTAGDVDPGGFREREHRRNPNARSNFIVSQDMDRALVFMGPIREGTLALATLDPSVAARLRAEHRKLWDTGDPYVDDLPLAEVAKNTGLLVRVRGRVQECVEYKEQHLLRITDGTHVVGAIVEEPLRLDGQKVVVTGRVVRGTSGYPLLDAEEVRLDGGSRQRITANRAAAPGPRQEEAAPQGEPDPTPAPTPTRTGKRVLRVPRKARSPEQEEDVEEPVEDPLVEFEESDEGLTEAERRRGRARVTLHR